jgi:hypothetical protein
MSKLVSVFVDASIASNAKSSFSFFAAAIISQTRLLLAPQSGANTFGGAAARALLVATTSPNLPSWIDKSPQGVLPGSPG